MIETLKHRPALSDDLETICTLPRNAEELFFMFPKGDYPLTTCRLASLITERYDSTIILLNEEIVGFANFYEVIENQYCSIGNVIVSTKYRGFGIGGFLVQTMEQIASENYKVSELRLSCFNNNTKGILLYTKLGYVPYAIEKRVDKDEKPIALIKMKHNLK